MSLATAEDVLQALVDGFTDFPPQLQRAARYLIDNPREVGVESMRSLASKSEVHPNTLVRLARQIGFDGYEGLRDRFRDFVVTEGMGGYGDRARWLAQLEKKGGSAEVIAQIAEATTLNLDTMWRAQDVRTIEKAADMILKAQNAYVLGVGAAEALAHQFWYVTRQAVGHITPIPRRGALPIDEVAWAGPKDVLLALTFQLYRAETMAAVRLAKEQGCKVVAVTDSLTSPLAQVADVTLVSPTHTPQFFQSHAAVTALLEGLVGVLVARAGDSAHEHIKSFHQRRHDAGAYEESTPLTKIG